MEYFEKFYHERYEKPCNMAKKAAEEWIQKRLGKDVLLVKDYNPGNSGLNKKGQNTRRMVWVVYDGRHIYWVVIKCNTYEASVTVSTKDNSQRAASYLTRAAREQGISLKLPSWSKQKN